MTATGKGRLHGRNCLLVGGTGGIGLATARRFLDEGARVVACGHTADSLAPAREILEPAASDRIRLVVADATDPKQVEQLFTESLTYFEGRLDVLYHVAGISGRRFGDGPLHECSVEGWDTVLNANARSVFLTNRAAVRRMLEQPVNDHGLRGTILNMGSVLGWSPAPAFFGTFAYAASKGAVRAMTLSAAARYAADRVRFNLIAPGLIETPMAQRAVSTPAIREYLETRQPIASGPGTPDDCAEAALYLCEPASRFLTGVVLNVDGGWCVSEGQIPIHPPDAAPTPPHPE